MPEDRRLAAIMFTDIVGYTKLMGEDENKAFKVLRKNREIQRPIIKKYRGEWLKEMGDGILASFHTASDAVRCAGEIQYEAKKTGISLRIGIHEGEVVFEGSDVLGDGVNVASRLEELAEEGCTFISDSVYKNIRNKKDIVTEFIGEKTLKNVDEPIKIYSIICEKLSEDTSNLNSSKSSLSQDKSIIVLPFVNISPDPDQEYFSDGLTEEIITDLSHIHDLMVISRSSAMTLKGTKSTIREIAEKVNVKYVLEGSVRKAGNNLRITAQLIDALTDTHLWAEKYSGTLDDIFDIQERVSRTIVDALRISLSSEEKDNIQKRRFDDSYAYEQYLLANREIWLCTKESLAHAIQIIESSINTIGRNEYLLVALSLAYFQYVNVGIDPDKKHLDKANELIKEALSLNPDISKAYYIRSMIQETKGELREAFISSKRAIELDQNDSDSLLMISFMYSLVGRPELAKPYAARAISIDPLNPIMYWGDWWVHMSEGKLDLVLEDTTKMYSLDNDNIASAMVYALSLVMNNRFIEANEVYEKFNKAYPETSYVQLFKGYRYAINNDFEKALQSITPELIKAAEMDHLWAWMLAQIYSIIGEKDKAIDFVERATRDVFINYPLFSNYDPLLENIRCEERFKKLMGKVKIEWENFEV